MQLKLTRTLVLTLMIVCLAAVAAEAQGNWRPGDFGSMRVRIGLFQPDGESRYWDEKFFDWTGSIDDFEDFSIGVDYVWQVGRSSGLAFGFDYYEGETTQAYRDYVDESGHDIYHGTILETTELTAAWILRLGGRHSSVSPYVGAGGGFVWWRLREAGRFIDFSDQLSPEIIHAAYESDGSALEAFLLAGLEFPMSDRWSFVAEGR